MEELKIATTEQETVREEPYKSGSVHYIDSREVAKLVGKDHDKLRRDIRRYTSHLDAANFGDISTFWMESTYADTYGRTQKCYLITEKGCEFIAHKLTGQKGSEFTAQYINRFHEMKGELEGQAASVLQEFVIQQAKFNQAVIERFEKMESRNIRSFSRNPFTVQQDVQDHRMRTLNSLVDQVADLCNMDRNKVLHYLYKTLQEDLGVILNPYLAVMKSESGDESICNLHVIASVDRFYEKAMEMCQDVIERKKLFG